MTKKETLKFKILPKEKILSILESIFFISKEPISLNKMETIFNKEFSKETIEGFLEELKIKYEEKERGLSLTSVNKGFQLRTKVENKEFLVNLLQEKPFRLSKASLEVLSIIAYNQPCTKRHVDNVRNIDSGHIMKTLIEKNLILFAGKSDEILGKPSLYKTSNKFLEVFNLNSLKDLPSEEEIKELFPDNRETQVEKQTLSDVHEDLDVKDLNIPYEKDEEENQKLKEALKNIPHSVDFLNNDKE